jgi:hypothetical protein
MSKTVVNAYRKAAQELFGANEAESKAYIVDPSEDPGEWAPRSLAVIYLEANFTFPEDTGVIPDKLGYWSPGGMDNCYRLGLEAGVGYIEYINAAVAAVYQ